ncbi:spliceosome associated protein, putative [Entamoeba invadens IP1]|uniref:spliceosome associated protein, putative n=1 Tax=Entamoeba invadens IP1 TaxID=370355 RepID=UPI0002C3E8DA|nr:spliceosome associated protein, putative [Entamoeba invadens IP1]ELP93837.1 spliceosome associated protein, putative [Entamoeba invadens IP1]|eukprot:XP_004260608.1 spliceosome associated protein, putative [Entamoeba invadens IP1]
MPPKPIKNRFVIQHPYITEEEDQIIKTTAQYTAKNGTDFIKRLAEREARNPVFYFLQKNHPNYQYFAQLCESYNQILHPKPQYLQFLSRTFENSQNVLKYSKMRADYEKIIESEKKLVEEKEAKEADLYNSINWNDFIVVEVVDFEDVVEEEHTTGLLQTINEKAMEEDVHIAEVEKFENKVDQIDNTQKDQLEQQDEVPRKKAPTSETLQVCPICKKAIPINEMDKHMKIELMSKSKKQQQKFEAPVAQDAEMAKNLENLTKNRPDWKN